MKTLIVLLVLAGAGAYFYLHSKNADPALKKEVQDYAAQIKSGVQKTEEAGKNAEAQAKNVEAQAVQDIKKAEAAEKTVAVDVKQVSDSTKKLKQDAKNALAQ
jgi:uncharacterized protein (UPF0333 family)